MTHLPRRWEQTDCRGSTPRPRPDPSPKRKGPSFSSSSSSSSSEDAPVALHGIGGGSGQGRWQGALRESVEGCEQGEGTTSRLIEDGGWGRGEKAKTANVSGGIARRAPGPIPRESKNRGPAHHSTHTHRQPTWARKSTPAAASAAAPAMGRTRPANARRSTAAGAEAGGVADREIGPCSAWSRDGELREEGVIGEERRYGRQRRKE